MKEKIILGKWTVEKIEHLLRKSSLVSISEKIEFISEAFLGTPYKEHPLSFPRNEIFVIDFEGFDCFTFIETIEAMRLSKDFAEFKKRLINIRYKNGRVSYRKRNHFFTDWDIHNKDFIINATGSVGGSYVRKVKKILNLKKDGTLIVPEFSPFERTIEYIPQKYFYLCSDNLRTGDYIGIYTDTTGLDCSHVGIFIRKDTNLILRHATSRANNVKDEALEPYLENKDGIIVLRPKDPSHS